jgi:hypothetical protein
MISPSTDLLSNDAKKGTVDQAKGSPGRRRVL